MDLHRGGGAVDLHRGGRRWGGGAVGGGFTKCPAEMETIGLRTNYFIDFIVIFKLMHVFSPARPRVRKIKNGDAKCAAVSSFGLFGFCFFYPNYF